MKANDTIEFFYHKFLYNPKNALIPRYETELLVREALKIINYNKIDIVIDVGTWTWIIPISIEKNINKTIEIYALEKSKKAISIANDNKKFLNSSIKIIESDLISYFFNKYDSLKNLECKNILFTANLPYIKLNDWINMSEDTRNEPKMALFWWKKTWFELYQKLIKQIIKFKDIYKAKKLILISEIWFDQRIISEDFLNILGLNPKYISDDANHDRIFLIDIPC